MKYLKLFKTAEERSSYQESIPSDAIPAVLVVDGSEEVSLVNTKGQSSIIGLDQEGDIIVPPTDTPDEPSVPDTPIQSDWYPEYFGNYEDTDRVIRLELTDEIKERGYFRLFNINEQDSNGELRYVVVEDTFNNYSAEVIPEEGEYNDYILPQGDHMAYMWLTDTPPDYIYVKFEVSSSDFGGLFAFTDVSYASKGALRGATSLRSTFYGSSIIAAYIPESMAGDRDMSFCFYMVDNLNPRLVNVRFDDAFYESTIEISSEHIDYLFEECTSLTSINLPPFSKLGGSMFRNTSLSSINIPESVLIIEDNCFMGAKLESIILPSNLEIIQDGALPSSIKYLEVKSGIKFQTGAGGFGISNLPNLREIKIHHAESSNIVNTLIDNSTPTPIGGTIYYPSSIENPSEVFSLAINDAGWVCKSF